MPSKLRGSSSGLSSTYYKMEFGDNTGIRNNISFTLILCGNVVHVHVQCSMNVLYICIFYVIV